METNKQLETKKCLERKKRLKTKKQLEMKRLEGNFTYEQIEVDDVNKDEESQNNENVEIFNSFCKWLQTADGGR